MDIQQAINQYAQYLSIERNCSPVTIKGYQGNLHRFTVHLTKEKGTDHHDVAEITTADIRSYIYALGNRGVKAKSLHRELCAIRGLFAYLIDAEILSHSPANKVHKPRIPQTKPNPLTEEEVHLFFNAIPRHTEIGKRDVVIMFTLLLRTGLRLQDFVQLQLRDLDLNTGELMVRQGKGEKDRAIPLSPSMVTMLQDNVNTTRPGFINTPTESLFLSRECQPFHPTSFRQRVYFYARKAGLSYRKVHPHTFRSTFATQLSRQAGADITVIKELMGHTDIQTTARYVGVVEANKRRAAEGIVYLR